MLQSLTIRVVDYWFQIDKVHVFFVFDKLELLGIGRRLSNNV